ncbi:MAG: translocation/assembly module TamB domain-containing protein, partial [Fimbriimonadaceae bacterium]
GEILQSDFDAFVDDLSVNGEIFGSGPLFASFDGASVAASGQIGSLDQFIELNALNYNTETEAVSGDVAAFNLDLSKVALALDERVKQLPQTAADLVMGSEAFASFVAEVDGTLNNPQVAVPGLQISDLNVLGRNAGVINATGVYADERVTLESLDWEDGETRLSAEGSYDLSEESADFDASLTNFDLSWVQQFSPETPDIRGQLNLDLAGAGPLSSLYARGSASVDELARVGADGEVQPLPISAAFPFIAFDGDIVETTGRAFVQGFPLDINASIPLNSLSATATTEVTTPMVVDVTLPERELSSLRDYLPELTETSRGTLAAEARLSGVLGRLELDASATVAAEQLGLEALDTTFSDVVARLNLDRKTANGFFSLTSNAGGGAQGRVDLQYPDLLEGGISPETILASTDISAFLSLERLVLQEQLPEADSPSRVNLDAEISAMGNLDSPVIDGIASLRQANIVLPSEFPESEEGGPLPINPSFDNLILNVDQGSTIRASTGSISAFGSGRLSGSLNSPNLVLPLTVSEGVFALPTNDVNLERGGTINVLYQGSRLRPSSAQVLLDLQATTTIFASAGAEAYEQYDVTLDITGDLLSDGELNIDAQSDPPDLTEDEILAVLGQRELIESVASSAFGGGQGGGLTQSLITAATPTLTGGLTDTVASSLTLDYLNVFYNPFDGFIATAGKSLGEGLILRGQRQLSETAADEEPSWELELNYRLPLQDSFFSRVRVGLGIDYETPWKVSIDWSRRF